MMRKTIQDNVFVLAAVFTAVLFFHPVLFSGKTFYFRDIHRFFYPMKYLLASSLKSGIIPFWNHSNFCGEPFFSFIQTGVFYPLSIVFPFLPFPFSLNLYVVTHFLLGFFFFYLFVTGIGRSRKAAVITGISYCYGSYMIASINLLINLSTLIWLPAVLWSFHRAVVKGRWLSLFATAVFLCMAILGGEPQLFIILSGMLLLFGLTWAPHGTHHGRVYLKNGMVILMLLFVSTAMTMAQLGPMYIDYLNSIRVDGIPYSDAAAFSLSWGMLKHLFLPLIYMPDFATNPHIFTAFFPGNGNMPWLLTIYPGFIIAPLALLNLFFNFSKKQVLWLVVFLVGLTLALGHNTPFHRGFYALFPFFRYPEKFMFPASFCLLVMAAYGLDFVMSRCDRIGISANRLYIVLFLVLTGDLYFAHVNMNPVCDAAFYRYRHPELNILSEDKAPFRVYVDKDIPGPPIKYNTIRDTHIFWQLFLVPNLGFMNHISHVNGESGMELKHQYFITEILSKPWREKIHFLRLANVRYIVTTEDLDNIPELSSQLIRVNALLFRLKDPMPRAWLIGNLQHVKRKFLEELADPAFDLKRSALAWGDIPDKYQTPFFKPVTRLAYEHDGSISIEAAVDAPSVLVLSESFYPGWRVLVDGKEKSCLKLNYLFQGVELEQGTHQISFVYRPEYFGLFLTISLISILIFIVAWVWCWVVQKKRRPVHGV